MSEMPLPSNKKLPLQILDRLYISPGKDHDNGKNIEHSMYLSHY